MSQLMTREPSARPGDRIEARGLPGRGTRHGIVREVLGREGHIRYRVAWEDGRESILFPADGVHVRLRSQGPG